MRLENHSTEAPQLISRKEAAQSLGISLGTLHSMIRDGRLPCVRLGRRVLIEPAALQRFVEANRVNTNPADEQTVK